MQFSHVLIPVAIFHSIISLSPTQSQNKSTATQESEAHQATPPKAINTPDPPYPEEARKKGIEGKVTLLIVIDGNGKVSEAKALSGPKELVPSTLAAVKLWQFEPTATAPLTRTVEIEYGFPKECPGPISTSGEVSGNRRLTDKSGNPVAVADEDEYLSPPPYPETERKAGVAGPMVLAITLGQDGHVKEIHATKSSSPGLDKAVIDTVRQWRFKKIEGSADASLENLRLEFTFRANCSPHF